MVRRAVGTKATRISGRCRETQQNGSSRGLRRFGEVGRRVEKRREDGEVEMERGHLRWQTIVSRAAVGGCDRERWVRTVRERKRGRVGVGERCPNVMMATWQGTPPPVRLPWAGSLWALGTPSSRLAAHCSWRRLAGTRVQLAACAWRKLGHELGVSHGIAPRFFFPVTLLQAGCIAPSASFSSDRDLFATGGGALCRGSWKSD